MLTMSTWDLFRWHETYWKLSIFQSSFVFHLPFVSCGFPIVFFTVCPPACQQCPAGSEPTLGYEYKWWNVLPSNMKTSCFNVGNSKCDSMNGRCLWQDMLTFSQFWSILSLYCVMTPMKWLKKHGKYLATISNTTLTATPATPTRH